MINEGTLIIVLVELNIIRSKIPIREKYIIERMDGLKQDYYRI